MMRKLLSFLVITSLFLSFFAGTVWAKNESKKEIPEVDGVYDDPDFPKIKVRVFVHKGKPVKPGNPTPPPPVLQCELEDLNSFAVVASAGWKLQSTWAYNLNLESVPSSVGSNNLPDIAGDGFSEWSSAITNKVAFFRGADTAVSRQAYDGLNIIAWGRISVNALGVTYIRYYSDTGAVVDVDTILNKKYSWMWSDLNTCAYLDYYDAENILTHELGHWVGLDDEYTSEYANATMYGYGAKGEVKKDTLTTGDIDGASGIYR